MRPADMLEHADRNDSVELPLDFSIVDQLELDVIRDACVLGTLACDLELLFRQRDPSTSTPATLCR